ncbi:MAG TPA: 50S ribosomal protein L9 [Bacillota bacterium]|nr:50S ribosomal protein L9 [Bacillota bacterium]
MRVILRQTVKGLGQRDDVVNVADGYGRNYLLPQGLAVEATAAGLKEVEAIRTRVQVQTDRDLRHAEEVRAKVDGLTVRVAARAGENGRLFGSVTAQDVADAIAAQAGVKVDRRRIELEQAIKTLGTYTAELRLHAKVDAAVRVEVAADKAEG